MRKGSTVPAIPAIVLGVDSPIGLAIVRSLGKHGVVVHAIGGNAGAIGLASRYATHSYIRATDETALIRQLLELRAETGPACLFTVSEGDITLLNRHRDALAGYTLLFPEDTQMKDVLDKGRTYGFARTVGIHVPATVHISSIAQVAEHCKDLQFPVVLKWADPNAVIKHLEAAGLEFEKMHYCFDLVELRDYLQRFSALGIYPMIQEYCPGVGLGQFFLMSHGEVLASFQHQRLHEWPPEGGISTLCESLPLDSHSELLQRSVALLRAMRWEGVAMVEYRYDPGSGKAALMEVNGRYWGSLPLACQAGAEFPWYAYCALGMRQPVRPVLYRTGMRCRFLVPELKRVFRLAFRRHHISDPMFQESAWRAFGSVIAGFLDPRMRYYVFMLSDPAPFFRDIYNVVAGAALSLLGQKRR
ncbi:MAG: carboxylate--amine ligase [Burkholderiaceae bacterium]|nr:MAG: carboxylate--amine ligase [Burkholderiaceae bacterium]